MTGSLIDTPEFGWQSPAATIPHGLAPQIHQALVKPAVGLSRCDPRRAANALGTGWAPLNGLIFVIMGGRAVAALARADFGWHSRHQCC